MYGAVISRYGAGVSGPAYIGVSSLHVGVSGQAYNKYFGVLYGAGVSSQCSRWPRNSGGSRRILPYGCSFLERK